MTLLRSIAGAASIAIAAITFTGPAYANANDAIIAGTAGFAAGALFGHATQPRYVAPPPRAVYVEPGAVSYRPARWSADWYSYCADRYASFDPGSGTFIGRDGMRHVCR
jgi:hypothetical protein